MAAGGQGGGLRVDLIAKDRKVCVAWVTITTPTIRPGRLKELVPTRVCILYIDMYSLESSPVSSFSH